jgi:hypothetical protein
VGAAGRAAAWLVEASDVERAVAPALADVAFEWRAARAAGRRGAATWGAVAALARVAFVLVPALVAARRARRLLEGRWAPLAPALGAAALGTWAFGDVAPSPAFVTRQLTFVAVGLGGAVAAGTTSCEGWRRFGPAWGVASAGALVAALGGEWAPGGAHRWVGVGPLRVQTSLLVWPLFVVGVAALCARRRYGAALLLVGASVGALGAQRDAATAVAWSAAACAAIWAAGAPRRWRFGAFAVGAAGAALGVARGATVGPVVHAEGVWGLLAGRGLAGAATALACVAAIVAAPFAAAGRAPGGLPRGVGVGAGTMLAALFLRPLVTADEPVPLLGYGGSGAIGVLLGLGLVVGLGGAARASRSHKSAEPGLKRLIWYSRRTSVESWAAH